MEKDTNQIDLKTKLLDRPEINIEDTPDMEGRKRFASNSSIIRNLFPFEQLTKVIRLGTKKKLTVEDLPKVDDDLLYGDYKNFKVHLKKNKNKYSSFHNLHLSYLRKETIIMIILYAIR